MSMPQRDYFVHNLKLCVGWPYKWGGSGPDGVDCSGLIIYCLGQVGIKIADTNAQGLFELYRESIVDRLQAPPGSLYFYGDDFKSIHHVMAVCDHWNAAGIVLVGARGGDSTTLTPEAAAEKRAFVDAVWGDYWLEKFVVAVDPFGFDMKNIGDETVIIPQSKESV